MGKKVRIVTSWTTLVNETSKSHGIPKKQIEETMGFVADQLNTEVKKEKEKLKNAGDKFIAATPLGQFTFLKKDEQIREKDGQQYKLNPSIAFGWSPSRQLIETANEGVDLKKVESKPLGEASA